MAGVAAQPPSARFGGEDAAGRWEQGAADDIEVVAGKVGTVSSRQPSTSIRAVGPPMW
jgi:hypothetical protein